MADIGRSPRGASLAGTAALLLVFILVPGAVLSGAAGGGGYWGLPGANTNNNNNYQATEGVTGAGDGGLPLRGSTSNTNPGVALNARRRRPPRPSQLITRGEDEAITRLSKVFGIDRLPLRRHHRSPPQYMVELYSTVAYRNGITRNDSPYGSDVIRGFPDRESREHMIFKFNVSYIHTSEKILQGEFHVFRLRARPPEVRARMPRGVHLVELRLYQILDPHRLYQPDGLKLLHFRRVSVQTHSWEVFKVIDTVQQWVNDSTKNHGLLLEATTLGGRHAVNGSYVRLAQRSRHHDSKQPVLVAFTENDRRHTAMEDAGSDLLPDDDGQEGGRRRQTQTVEHRTYVQFLNERHRAKHGNYRLFPSSSKTYPQQDEADDLDDLIQSSATSKSAASAILSRRRRSADFYNSPRKRKQTCSRHEMYVDFDEIGWSGWIISPKGYNAYHCKGECPFPLGQNQKPTNHATVQSIVHALRIGKNIGTPCCVPNKLYSFSLLYFDDDENVILKRYDDMVAASCGCH